MPVLEHLSVGYFAVIGEHLLLPSVLRTIVGSSIWFTSFYEDDITQKEVEERTRDENFYSHLIGPFLYLVPLSVVIKKIIYKDLFY